MRILLVTTFLFAAVFVSNGQEVGASQARSISVSGTAERISTANQIRISVEIRTVDEQLSEAQGKSKKVFDGVIEDIGALGVKAEEVQLKDHEFGKEYVDGPNRQKIWKGFFSTREFLVILDQVDQLELIHSKLAENPEIEVSGTRFLRTDDIEIRKELRTEALKAAREKASAMAEVYELTLGKPLKIEEGNFNGYFLSISINITRNTGIDRTQEGVARGKVSLYVTVKVVFELVN